MKYLLLLISLYGCVTMKAGEEDARYIGGCSTPMGEKYAFKNVTLKPFGSGLIIEDMVVVTGDCFFNIDDEKAAVKFFNSDHINWIKRPGQDEVSK